ncbi:MAG: M24 family metallopeptidase [Candidatus Jordarchaeales archaeon]
MHSTYELYYSDLAYNVVMGKADNEQRKMIETFVELSYILIDNVAPGVTVGEVAKKIMEKLNKTEYAPHTPPVFGHGIGIVGHEWYPPITIFEPWTSYEFREGMVEELYLQINKPGVGGLRLEIPVLVTKIPVLVTKRGCEKPTKTPIEPAEHQPD